MPRILLDDQRATIQRLVQLVTDRVRAESSTRASFDAREATLREQFAAERQRLQARQSAEREAIQSDYANTLTRAAHEYEETVEAALREHERAQREANSTSEKAIAGEGAEWEQQRQRLNGNFDAEVRELARGLQEFKDRLDQHRDELQVLDEAARRILKRRLCLKRATHITPPTGKCEMGNPIGSFSTSLADAKQALHALAAQRLPSFLFTLLVLMLPVLIVTVGLLTAGFLTLSSGASAASGASASGSPGNSYFWFAAIGAVVIGGMSIVFVVIRPLVISHSRDAYAQLQRHLADGSISLDAASRLRAAEADMKKITLKQQRNEKLRKLDLSHRERLDSIAAAREAQLRAAAAQLQEKKQAAAEIRDRQQQAVNERYTQQSQQLAARHAAQNEELQRRAEHEMAASREMYSRSWSRLVSQWKGGLAEAQEHLDELARYCRARFPDWNTTNWETWQPPDDSLPVLKFGSYLFQLERLAGGMPEHEDLRPPHAEFVFPAAMSFTDRPALLLEAWEQGRNVASRAM